MPTTTKKPLKKADSSQEELNIFIPTEEDVSGYIHRSINGQRDVDLLNTARLMKVNTIIAGPTGPGKTSCIKAYAHENNLPLLIMSMDAAKDPRQLFGGWKGTSTAGKYEWQDGPVTTLVRNGGVADFAEINFLDPKIAATLYTLLRERKLLLEENGNEYITAHDDFQVVADYNPGYEGTRRISEGLMNRFAMKLRFDYDREIESQLIGLTSLLDLATALRNSPAGLDTPVSTNMLVEFEDFAYELSIEFAMDNFINAFSNEERAAVKEVVTLHAENIRTEWNAEMGV